MLIYVAENPQNNSYTTSLINAYRESGNIVVCDPHNFFYSDLIPEVLHIHWPERLYQWYPLSEKTPTEKIEILKRKLEWYKSKGTVIVFTVHDLVLHFSKDRTLDEKMFKLIIAYSNVICHHCLGAIGIFTELYPEAANKHNIVNHHGDYLIDYQNISKQKARTILDIPEDKFVILNFGSQQAYKGREFIEKVFNSCNINNKYLLTAGNYYYRDLHFIKKIIMEIRNASKVKKNFIDKKFIYRIIPNEEIPIFFSASDLVFLGHKRGLVSGLIPLAATYSKPVVYPELGCFNEQMNDWFGASYETGNKAQALEAIKALHYKLQKMSLDNTAWLEKNSWKNHIRLILKSVEDFRMSSD